METHNSKFFHAMIRWRRRKSGINGVLCQDKWIEESNIIKDEVLKFFSNRMPTLEDFGSDWIISRFSK